MKKLFIILIALISVNVSAQIGVATASNQTLEIAAIKSNSTISVTGVVITSPSITALIASASSVTTSGTVTAGSKYILFETSSDFVGTIEGLRFLNNGFLPYPYLTNGTWPAISYVVTSGTLYIRKYN